MPAAAFAARERMNPRRRTYWRWRLRTEHAVTLPNPRRPAPFVEVVVPPRVRDTPAGLKIVVPPGYRVRVGEVVSRATFRTVLDVLEARG